MLVLTFMALVSVAAGSRSIYDFKLNDINGDPVYMATYKGKVLLILNTASQCGYTDGQLTALKRLHDILSYSGKFEILAFPCNDYGEQEPWEAQEINEFVTGHHKCEFPLMEKVSIEGNNPHPLWKHIIETTGIWPNWNFQKYLYDSTGNFISSWDGSTSIESIFEKIQEQVKKAEKSSNQNDQKTFNKVEL